MMRRVPQPSQPTTLEPRESCRICGAGLAPAFDLGTQFVAGAFPRPGEDVPALRESLPLELVRCDVETSPDACGLVQLHHSVPGSLLYHSYWYRSGINRTMTANLHEIAGQAEMLVHPEPGDLIIDIGCNDGTLFDGYGSRDCRYLGIDPSDVTRYAVEKGYDVVNDFFSAEAVRNRYPEAQARIVTSIAMFYDLEDPGMFVRDVASVLAPGGVWVIELSYLPTMLETNAFDTICHEHLEYYSLAVLERLLRGAGLTPVRVELNSVNGGSIRLFAAHEGTLDADSTAARELGRLRTMEGELGLDTSEPYEGFRSRVEQVRRELREVIQGAVAGGQTVHVYGASTKGNTILQYCGLDSSLIPFAADRNPDKWGAETVSTRIPIISEEESRAMNPDYYLALPWHFLDEFIGRERDFLTRGGKFIVPLPNVRAIGKGGTIPVEATPLAASLHESDS
jgi:SAM-dependent methyltransferase